MKGIIFNLAQEVVSNAHGEDAWDAVLDGAGLEGAWTVLGDYPDEHLSRVVTSAAALLGVDEQDVYRTVALGSIPLLAQRYPHFFTPHTDAYAFTLTLNDMIHPEVLKLYPGATPPSFGFEGTGTNAFTLSYSSPRHLCSLAEGFLQGAATHYKQAAVISQASCMLRGDDRCLIHCEFTNAAV